MNWNGLSLSLEGKMMKTNKASINMRQFRVPEEEEEKQVPKVKDYGSNFFSNYI